MAFAQIAIFLGAVVMELAVPLPFSIGANSIIIFVAVAVNVLIPAAAEGNA